MKPSGTILKATFALLAAAVLPSVADAFYQCAAHAPGGGDAPETETGSAPVLTGIVSLKLRIDTKSEMSLLDQSFVSGSWTDRRVPPMGTRLYYEVVDASGTVVSRGYRKDPRDLNRQRAVEFLLNAPCTADAAQINVYLVNYEGQGKDGYSRDYRLLGSYPLSLSVAGAEK